MLADADVDELGRVGSRSGRRREQDRERKSAGARRRASLPPSSRDPDNR
jgi:hypothetical protein